MAYTLPLPPPPLMSWPIEEEFLLRLPLGTYLQTRYLQTRYLPGNEEFVERLRLTLALLSFRGGNILLSYQLEDSPDKRKFAFVFKDDEFTVGK